MRVVSYNVCGFGAGFGPPRDEAVTAMYGQLRADLVRLAPQVVCLQEARRLPLRDPEGQQREDSLDALAADLGMTLLFAHATPGFEKFGNAVLVGPGLRLLGSTATHLDGGSVVTTPAGGQKRIVRGCLAARLASERPGEEPQPFAVLATHWDHISERERLVQAQCVLSRLEELAAGLPHLLVGDLNSMKRRDYSTEEWTALEDRNAQRGWAPPEDSAALAALEVAGYSDLLQETLASRTGSLGSGRFTSLGPPPARIDYAYASPEWAPRLRGAAPSRGAAAWVDTAASGSDHLPLVVDMPVG